jgi:cell division protein FtsB
MKFFQSRLFKIIVSVVNLLIIISLIGSILDLNKRWDIVKNRETALRHLEQENQKLKRSLEDAQSPDFIEKEARDTLGLAKPGDSVVIMEKQAPITSTTPQNSNNTLPVWQQWWQLFF